MSVYKRGKIYWYEFWFRGHRIRESTGLQNKAAAQNAEAIRKAGLAEGRAGIAAPRPAVNFGDFVRDEFLPWEVRESVYNGLFSTPKTHSSMRRIPLSSPAVELFRNRKIQAVKAGPKDLVFATRKGTPLRPANILKRAIHPACDRLGMPRVGWHTFRHTHATLLNELGESAKTAQAILGHSDIQTTLQVYTHAIPESVSRAEERLAQKLLGPNGPKLETGSKLEPEETTWIQ